MFEIQMSLDTVSVVGTIITAILSGAAMFVAGQIFERKKIKG